MSFKVRKIQDNEKSIKNRFWRWMVRVFGPKLSVLLLVVFLISLSFTAGALFFGRQIVDHTVRKVGKFVNLKSDDLGHTNLLLLETAGQGRRWASFGLDYGGVY